jgi:3-deoxy-manno-octulosonate cytidylyltransferase (CMP-KDO synthetase)
MVIGAVIPARYGSTRFPGKPLVQISGKSMIEHVYTRVAHVPGLAAVLVATDDQRIESEVRRFGGQACLTPSALPTGTDRVFAASAGLGWDAVINIQGDEPLIAAALIVDLVRLLQTGAHAVVTAASLNDNQVDFLSPHVVKAVVAASGSALYFTRAPVPHPTAAPFVSFLHHIGIYGYTVAALDRFIHSPQSELEKTERLEQLRFLENGVAIQVVRTGYRSQGVDVPEDVFKIEALLREEHA